MVRSFEQICELESQIKEGKSDVQVFDARGEESYNKGHIEVSKNISCLKFHNPENNTAKKPEEVLKIMQENGVDLTKPIVSTCGGCVTATYNFANFKNAGITNVACYDGAWAEYVRLLMCNFL